MDVCNINSDPTLENRLTQHGGEVTGLSFHPDCNQLASSSTDSTLILWNLKKHVHTIKFESHLDQVTDVFFSPNAKVFASSSKDRTVRLWKPSIKCRSKVITAHTSAVSSTHVSADSTVLLSASTDKTIKMWMSEYNNKFICTFKNHKHWVNCARFSIDEKYVVSCSEDKTTKLWDRNTNCPTHSYEEKVTPKYVEFHPNNKCIGVALSNGHIKIYDIRNHKLLQFYSVHKQCVNKLSFHPNGNFFISGSSDGSVKVYNVIEGSVIYTLEGHDGAVTAVAFSPDGNRFATAGVDKSILVWNTNFHEEVLARPLGQCSVDARQSEVNPERRTRTVDARLSFSTMEQPQVDDSSVQNSPTEEKGNGLDSTESCHPTNVDDSQDLPGSANESKLTSVETAVDTISAQEIAEDVTNAAPHGDATAVHEDPHSRLADVKERIDNLKLEDSSVQNSPTEEKGNGLDSTESCHPTNVDDGQDILGSANESKLTSVETAFDTISAQEIAEDVTNATSHGDATAVHEDPRSRMADVKERIDNLKLEVCSLQSQLKEIMDIIETEEKRQPMSGDS